MSHFWGSCSLAVAVSLTVSASATTITSTHVHSLAVSAGCRRVGLWRAALGDVQWYTPLGWHGRHHHHSQLDNKKAHSGAACKFKPRFQGGLWGLLWPNRLLFWGCICICLQTKILPSACFIFLSGSLFLACPLPALWGPGNCKCWLQHLPFPGWLLVCLNAVGVARVAGLTGDLKAVLTQALML